MRHNGKGKVMELGTEIIGRFGAMLPEEVGEVVMIGNFSPEIKVKWEDGKKSTWLSLSEIRDDYFDPKLPAIGYFAIDTDRAWDWVE
jgi:hypothetical protein